MNCPSVCSKLTALNVHRPSLSICCFASEYKVPGLGVGDVGIECRGSM